jgi:hypothetical protein
METVRPVIPSDNIAPVARVLCEAYRAWHGLGIDGLHKKLQDIMAVHPCMDALVVAFVIEMEEDRKDRVAGRRVPTGDDAEIFSACQTYTDPSVMDDLVRRIVEKLCTDAPSA